MYLSAVFPKGVALCGEIADGIILTRSTLRTAASVRVQLAEAAHRVGRDPAKIEVTSLLPTSVGDTREAALATLRPGLVLYAGFFPRYNRRMAAHGYPVEAAAIAEAWARQPRSDRACPCRSCLSRGTESLRTRRWRKQDSNRRSPSETRRSLRLSGSCLCSEIERLPLKGDPLVRLKRGRNRQVANRPRSNCSRALR